MKHFSFWVRISMVILALGSNISGVGAENQSPSNPSEPTTGTNTWEWTNPTPGSENEREKLTVAAQPAGGNFTKTVKVKLVSNKPNAKIFYAFSGQATPDQQYEYTGPITLKASSELWFFAFTDSTDATLIQNETYTILPTKNESGSGSLVLENSPVTISEIYPNPAGQDSQGEWIELQNTSDETLSLKGYYLQNKSKKKFTFSDSSSIGAKGFSVIPIQGSGFQLGNSHETISLYNDRGERVDRIFYVKALTGNSIVRYDETIGLESDFPTAGLANTRMQLLSSKEDMDYDLLDAITETSLGTSLKKFDTDGDRLPDGFENWYGSNPLKKDRTKENYEAYQQYLSRFFTVQTEMQKRGMYLTGKSFPKSTIRLTLSSGTKTFRLTTKVRATGTFSVLAKKIPKGNYTVTAVITDRLGNRSLSTVAVDIVL